MTKPEPFDEATAQWVYEKMRKFMCTGYEYDCYEAEHSCTTMVGMRDCTTSRKNCPLFKESEQE